MKISVVRYPGRRSPWAVQYYVARKRKMRFFKTREAAESHAADLRLLDRRGARIDKIETAIQLVAGTGYDICELVRLGLQAIHNSGASDLCLRITFREMAQKYLDDCQKKGLRKKTLQTYKGAFNALNKTWGDRIVGSIIDSEVERYLLEYPDNRGNVGKAAFSTRECYLHNMQTIMRAAGVPKPLSKVVLPRESREVRCFSILQVKTMLAAAWASERGMLALALFAGIRPERLPEIPKHCINVVDRTIRIPGAIAKTHQPAFLETVKTTGMVQEFRPGPPEVLWAWLEKYPFEPRAWRRLQTRLKRKLGGQWIHDGCRHTAATYYCAKYGVGATAELLTHNDTGLVRKHYAGIATREQVEAFFRITPESVPLPTAETRYSGDRKKIKVSPEEIAQLVRTTTITAIAKRFDCSTALVRRYCQKWGIDTPGRGRWATRLVGPALGNLRQPEEDARPKNVVTGSTLRRKCDGVPPESSQSTTKRDSEAHGSSQVRRKARP